MKISIVVPAFNEEKLLERSLQAIKRAAQGFAPDTWELIVCDNNSTDLTAEIARGAGARVVFEGINQISRARNCGAAAASGDWIVFVDADSFPTAALFARARNLMGDPRCAGGGCLVKLDEQEPLSALLVAAWNFISRAFHLAAGSFVFCDAGLFREVGGFSKDLFASEEVDLCRKLKCAARGKGRRLFIIKEERLLTSARKMHLYSKGEHLKFIIKAMLFPRRRILGNRDQCELWYSGRR